MILDFDPERYPRSMTRDEWSRTYRWVRETRKRFKSNEEKALAAALLCGDERIRRQVLDSIIFPPVMMVPGLPQNQNFNITPGSIAHVTHIPRKRFLP